MKTIEIKLYKFAELSEDAQQTAINNLSNINVDYEWWKSTYEDAKRVGITINGFEMDKYYKGKIYDTEQTAHDILKEHGETCSTYQTVFEYLKNRNSLIENWFQDENGDYVNENDLDTKLDQLGEEFEDSLLEDYRIMLSNEYNYLTTKQAIIETIESNDYDFTEDGKIY